MNKRIDIQTIQAGQPRAYADSIYEATIDFNFTDNDKLQWDPPREIVEQIARMFVHDWVEINDDGTIGWWQPTLDFLRKTSEGQWHIKVTLPYTD